MGRRSIPIVGIWVATTSALLAACGLTAGEKGHGVESVHTGITGPACRQRVDPDDPNSIPYRVCPGVAGFSLVVRKVGSGRRSLEVVTPQQEHFPLDLHVYVSAHMLELEPEVEWRVRADGSALRPVALIAGVRVHGSPDEPAEVTETLRAVAKITDQSICVTHRLPVSSVTPAQVQEYADHAPESACLAPLTDDYAP